MTIVEHVAQMDGMVAPRVVVLYPLTWGGDCLEPSFIILWGPRRRGRRRRSAHDDFVEDELPWVCQAKYLGKVTILRLKMPKKTREVWERSCMDRVLRFWVDINSLKVIMRLGTSREICMKCRLLVLYPDDSDRKDASFRTCNRWSGTFYRELQLIYHACPYYKF